MIETDDAGAPGKGSLDHAAVAPLGPVRSMSQVIVDPVDVDPVGLVVEDIAPLQCSAHGGFVARILCEPNGLRTIVDMPRSRHAEDFNHDEEAAGYDADVRNEEDPIRAGYAELLDWLAVEAGVTPASSVLELGSGTGNLSARLGPARETVCVDVSEEMMLVAREKLAGRSDVTWVRKDLLEYFDTPGPSFDVVVSSYAIHHLTDDEKQALFARVAARLNDGGRVSFGDLMFESPEERGRILAGYRETRHRGHLPDGIEEEFFWDVARSQRELRELGFDLKTKRFSELSWGMSGRLR